MFDRRAVLSLLSERYVVSVLVLIYELSLSGPVRKYDLLTVVSSGNTIDSVVRMLSEVGLVRTERINIPRKTIFLRLTPAGAAIAIRLSSVVSGICALFSGVTEDVH